MDVFGNDIRQNVAYRCLFFLLDVHLNPREKKIGCHDPLISIDIHCLMVWRDEMKSVLILEPLPAPMKTIQRKKLQEENTGKTTNSSGKTMVKPWFSGFFCFFSREGFLMNYPTPARAPTCKAGRLPQSAKA